MAKKRKQYRRLIEQTVIWLYSNGVSQSCVFHTALFIILSLMISIPPKPIKPLVLNFSMETTQEISIEEQFVEIPIEEPAIDPIDNSAEIEDATDELLVSENNQTEIKPNLEDIDHNNDISSTEESLNLSLSELTSSLNAEEPKGSELETTENSSVFTSNILGANSGLGSRSSIRNGNGEEPGLSELDRRLKQYGAQSGEIQISLSWNSVDDIDLHVVIIPINSQINWMNKRGSCGGMLDIDMNAHPQLVSQTPIENIFWPDNQAPKGTYIIGVQNYMPWSRNPQTEVLLVIKVKDRVLYKQKILSRYGDGLVEAYRFNF